MTRVTSVRAIRAGDSLVAPATVRAGVYARLSKDPDGKKTNIEGQVRRCHELAADRGWTVAEIYIDRDKTAAGRDPFRPDYERLISDLRSGRINAVVALDQDRLVREPYELELLLRVFEDVGARHLLTSDGEVTAEGVLHARIRASISAEEIRKMRERQKRRQEDIALEGRWGGGFRPFGYSVVHRPGDPVASKTGHVLMINEAEAALLHDAAHRIASGESAEGIAQEWNAAGIVTVTGKRWRGKSLRRILTAASITGLREHHGEIVADAAWPPILDRATWEAVRTALAARPEAKVGRPPREYLLTGGLAVCGLCGAPLRARPRADKVRSYTCVAEERADGSRPCGGVRCVAEPLEELIFEAVLAALDAGALDAVLRSDLDEEADARRNELLAVLAEAEGKLALAEERYLEGEVSKAAYLRVRDRHTGVAENARRELAAIERTWLTEDTPRSVDELRQWWPEATLLQKRAFLKLFIEKVRVLPALHRGARFSKERAEIHWMR
ncbi:MAG: recombinase family protein [Actinomycetota bacterium]|nr:recombinase family protein [Actinomycetota bacterium]MDP9459247.1 recombinase family protein [Actinomycetota bacterium]